MFKVFFFNQTSLIHVVQVIDEILTIEVILFSDFHLKLTLIDNFYIKPLCVSIHSCNLKQGDRAYELFKS